MILDNLDGLLFVVGAVCDLHAVFEKLIDFFVRTDRAQNAAVFGHFCNRKVCGGGGESGIQLGDGLPQPGFQNDLRRSLSPEGCVLTEGLVIAVFDFPAESRKHLHRVEFERAFTVRISVGHTTSASTSCSICSTLTSPETSLGRRRSRTSC
jgi:hypothetical protein